MHHSHRTTLSRKSILQPSSSPKLCSVQLFRLKLISSALTSLSPPTSFVVRACLRLPSFLPLLCRTTISVVANCKRHQQAPFTGERCQTGHFRWREIRLVSRPVGRLKTILLIPFRHFLVSLLDEKLMTKQRAIAKEFQYNYGTHPYIQPTKYPQT